MPHDNDTGGFFVALLRKRTPWPPPGPARALGMAPPLHSPRGPPAELGAAGARTGGAQGERGQCGAAGVRALSAVELETLQRAAPQLRPLLRALGGMAAFAEGGWLALCERLPATACAGSGGPHGQGGPGAAAHCAPGARGAQGSAGLLAGCGPSGDISEQGQPAREARRLFLCTAAAARVVGATAASGSSACKHDLAGEQPLRAVALGACVAVRRRRRAGLWRPAGIAEGIGSQRVADTNGGLYVPGANLLSPRAPAERQPHSRWSEWALTPLGARLASSLLASSRPNSTGEEECA